MALPLSVLLATAPAASAEGLPPIESDVFPARAVVDLRLDRELHARPPADGVASPPPASVVFGLSLLENRSARARAESRAQEALGEARLQALRARERNISDLQRLLASQDQLISTLQGRKREAATVSSAPPASPQPAEPPVSETPPEPAVAPPPAAAQPGLMERLPLPSGLLLQGGLLLALALLLAWVMILRGRRRAQTFSEGAAARDEGPSAGEEEKLRAAVREKAQRLARAGPRPNAAAAAAPARAPGGTPGRADAAVLKEVDTLIAFEDYQQAGKLLRQALAASPENAEYRLRLLHVESALGNAEASAVEEEILANIMMDGPLSGTINRVLQTGREMLPGHPLFEAERWEEGGENSEAPERATQKTLRIIKGGRQAS